jgi:hypothetical protein
MQGGETEEGKHLHDDFTGTDLQNESDGRCYDEGWSTPMANYLVDDVVSFPLSLSKSLESPTDPS